MYYCSFQYPRCPNQQNKTSAVFGHFGTVFNQMVGAPWFSKWDVILPAYPPVQTQKWNSGCQMSGPDSFFAMSPKKGPCRGALRPEASFLRQTSSTWRTGTLFCLLQSRRRTKVVRKVFWKCCPRAEKSGRFCGPFEALEAQSEKIGPFQGQDLGIRGQNIAPHFLVPVVGSEFDVDYDFAIKHYPIQSDDWVMDVCGMAKSFWAPKIRTIP